VCLEVCDAGLWPVMLFEAAKAGRYDDCRKLGIDDCTDCDDCTRECPAEMPLNKYLKVARLLSFYSGDSSGLIPVLLEIQANFGYLPAEMIRSVSGYLGLPEGHIYSVASFYSRLRLVPPGRRHIRVCQGTACHISASSDIMREVSKTVGIDEGETSSDHEYTLDTVACIGCCALAPCLSVNDKVYGKLNGDKVRNLLGATEARDGRSQ
jgi:NADH-quinone oxidoreductase subunit E